MSGLIIRITIVLMYCCEVNLQNTDTNKIVFRYPEKFETEFVVERHKPLNIHFSNFYPKHLWCLNFNYTDVKNMWLFKIPPSNSSGIILSYSSVEDSIARKWWCVILRKYKVGKIYVHDGRNYTACNIVFDLVLVDPKSAYYLVYIISGVGLALVLSLTIVILTIKFCSKKSNTQLPLDIIDPDRVFYLNLEIFRRQYEQELQAQEPEYEEID